MYTVMLKLVKNTIYYIFHKTRWTFVLTRDKQQLVWHKIF
jgi:hypothetical protein